MLPDIDPLSMGMSVVLAAVEVSLLTLPDGDLEDRDEGQCGMLAHDGDVARPVEEKRNPLPMVHGPVVGDLARVLPICVFPCTDRCRVDIARHPPI